MYRREDRLKLARYITKTVSILQDQYLSGSSNARGQLAQLRRAVTAVPGSSPGIWSLEIECLPAELVGTMDGMVFPGEWASHLAVTLYAVHQQSMQKPMNRKLDFESNELHGLGHAINKLVYINNVNHRGEELESGQMPSRFAALVTAESIEETAHYARQIIQQLRGAQIPLDYGRFAGQLYAFQFPSMKDKVRLEWAREFAHRQTHEVENNNE